MSKRIRFLLGVSILSVSLLGCSRPSDDEIDNYISKLEQEAIEQMVEDRQTEEYYENMEANAGYSGESFEEVHFIDNGYYYHEDTTCKGLDGYNYNTIYKVDLYEHQELDPCNWCATTNESETYNSEIDESEVSSESSVKDIIKESVKAELEKKRAERAARGELTIDQLIKQDNLKENEVLFLLKGYYYHSTPDCKGLEDCYDIKKGDKTEVINELGLKPCNWCSK